MSLEDAARALLADYDAGVIFNQEAGITTLGWPEMEALRAGLAEASVVNQQLTTDKVMSR